MVKFDFDLLGVVSVRISIFLCFNVCFAALLFFSTMTASYAQSTRANIPQFLPASEWEVKSTDIASARGLEALKLPCVMKIDYNNGFLLRFAGGGKRILSMAADFRQPIFNRDGRYQARLSLDGTALRTIEASAFSDSVLLFNLESLGNIYSSLSKAKTLQLEVEGNKMSFNLGNVQTALARLDQCFTGTTGLTSGVLPKSTLPDQMIRNGIQSSQPAPDSFSDTNLSRPRLSRPVIGEAVFDNSPRNAAAEITKSMREPRVASQNGSIQSPIVETPRIVPSTTPLRVEKLQIPDEARPLPRPSSLGSGRVSRAISDGGSVLERLPSVPRVVPDVQPESSALPLEAVTVGKAPTPLRANANTWTASAGDDMRGVLERWGSRAGVDVQWDAVNNGRVASDVNVTGTFEQAVQTLMAQNAAALGLEADMRQSAAQTAPVFTQASNSVNGHKWQGSLGQSKWVAARGASLRETLQRWSVQDGTAFLWKAGREYKVKETVQNNGNYTEALQQLLNQYADDTIRPAAQFNADPVTGNKLLTVE